MVRFFVLDRKRLEGTHPYDRISQTSTSQLRRSMEVLELILLKAANTASDARAIHSVQSETSIRREKRKGEIGTFI